MEITTSEHPGPITVIHLTGKLDGNSYLKLIAEAEALYSGGVRDLVIDLGQITYISSAGISALHRTAMLFRGEKQNAKEVEGWGAYQAIAQDREKQSIAQKHVKLLNPAENVHHSLDMVGFTAYFEIFTSLDEALAALK